MSEMLEKNRGLRDLISRKLGRCPRCMRTCAKGTVASWATVAATVAFFPHPALVESALLVAASFTLLLGAHLATVTARVAQQPAALPRSGTASESRMGRREAVVGLGQAAIWTAIFGLELLWTPRVAQAQTVPCERQPAFGPLAFGPTNVSATDRRDAEEFACRGAADAHCNAFATLVCKFCRVKTGQNKITCTATCTETARHLFSCTGTVSGTGCDCRTK